MDIPIIILAAGASSRMRGRDKLLEDIDGVPLLRHQVEKARAITSAPVLALLPPAPHPRYAALDGLEVQSIPVPDAATGMNASLRAGIAALPSETPAAMILLGDLPDITADDLCTVALAVDLNSDTLIWRGATEQGAAGHPIVFHADLFPYFETLSGDSGGREVVKQAQGRVRLIPLEGNRARHDLDTPEDWAKWRATRT